MKPRIMRRERSEFRAICTKELHKKKVANQRLFKIKPRIISQMRRNFPTTCTQIVHEEKSCKQMTIRRGLHFLVFKKNRPTPLSDGFALILGFMPVLRRIAPIVGSFCRPYKISARPHLLKHPTLINWVIGGNLQNTACFQQPRQLI